MSPSCAARPSRSCSRRARKRNSRPNSRSKTAAALEQAAKLVDTLKSLHEICLQDENPPSPDFSDKKKDQIKVPELDQDALEAFEQALKAGN